jgi:hypothetical protein
MNSKPYDSSDPDFEPRPYPLWWDYLNGAIVAFFVLATAAMVLSWMVGVSLSVLK